MATASNICLTGNEKLSFAITPLRLDSANKASELLNVNHVKWDTYLNDQGHHNHLVHHILTLYALGATPDEIQAAYDEDVNHQRIAFPPYQKIIDEIHTPAGFNKYLGDYTQYTNYLVYFTAEVEAKGVPRVLDEYLFAGDERANDMLSRLFVGFGHALIHLGYAIEFRQPALVAEALAQTAVHEPWGKDFFEAAERAGEAHKKAASGTDPSMLQLLEETREQILQQPEAADYGYRDNCIKYGIVHLGSERLLPVLAKWVVRSEDDLAQKTAENIDASVFYNVAAQHPPHIPKIDFFYLHSTTVSVHFIDFLTNPWLSPAARVRLLEWKGRWDLANYASRGAAQLLRDEVAAYPADRGGWDSVIARANRYIHEEDSGHTAKMIRAVVAGWRFLEGRERKGFALESEEMWLKAASLGMDSVEAGSPVWVRGAGFEEGWADIPLREGKKANL
ncbi:hypothetical protein BFW01_g12857 [Lasiodiplodia theobromae]|nr:hypothetical protein BFW01_g12857 [Lasiodiplodia theobromae]